MILKRLFNIFIFQNLTNVLTAKIRCFRRSYDSNFLFFLSTDINGDKFLRLFEPNELGPNSPQLITKTF